MSRWTPPDDESLGGGDDPRELPVVMIFWRDAASSGGWKSISRTRRSHAVRCRSVGFLTKATPNELQVVQSIGGQGEVNDQITIPRAWVRQVVLLRHGRQPKEGKP